MTDDKTRQEGTPSADPIQGDAGQLPADQQTPAADQEGAGSATGNNRAARIVDSITINVDTTEGMTAAEIAEYAREHPEEWQQMTDGLKNTFKTMGDSLNSSVTDALRAGIIQTYKGKEAADQLLMTRRELEEKLKVSFGPVQEAIKAQYAAAKKVSDILNTSEIIQRRFKEVFSGMTRIAAILAESAPGIERLDALFTEIDELKPFITDIMENDPETKGKTIDDLLNTLPLKAAIYIFCGLNIPEDQEGRPDPAELPEDERDAINKIIDIIRQARDARDAQEAAEATPHAIIKRAESVEYPLDKPNSKLWNLLEKDTAGQVEFNLAKNGSKLYLPAVYSINFDGLGNDISITKRLTPFDKLAYIAIAALFNAGNNIITLQQIYYAMGYTGTPGDTDRNKIYNTVHKMRKADIFFDNDKESAAYKYTRFKYEGALLPCEIGEAFINGKWTDKAIHIFREPPLITFAKERKQITTLDIKLLRAPVSKTDANLQIQDYLLERISKAKNGRGKHCRILYKTLFSNANIATKKQQQRAPAKFKKYLEHYQREGFIKNFTIEKDGLTVYWE